MDAIGRRDARALVMTDNSAGSGADSAEDMGLESILDDILDDGQSAAPDGVGKLGEMVSEDEIADLLGEKPGESAAVEGEIAEESEPDSEDTDTIYNFCTFIPRRRRAIFLAVLFPRRIRE